jgi:hypothetical protein
MAPARLAWAPTPRSAPRACGDRIAFDTPTEGMERSSHMREWFQAGKRIATLAYIRTLGPIWHGLSEQPGAVKVMETVGSTR